MKTKYIEFLKESVDTKSISIWKLYTLHYNNTLLDMDMLYHIEGDFNDVDKWTCNSFNKGNDNFDIKHRSNDQKTVYYVMFNMIDKFFLPIAETDEHHTGYDLLHDLKVTDADNYLHINMLGNNYIKEEDINIYYTLYKELYSTGWRPTYYVSISHSDITVPMIEFIKTGKIEYKKGELAKYGKELVERLKELKEKDNKILFRGNDKMVDIYLKKSINLLYWLNSIDFPLDIKSINYKGKFFSITLEKFIKEIKKLEVEYSEDRFKKCSVIIFGLNGIKNIIHSMIKQYLKDKNARQILKFFGDVDMANGIFQELDNM
jgi:hypothetical protein